LNARFQLWLFRLFGREITVPLSNCVHFCGYRYGRGEFNPYENYAIARVRGASEEQARGQFVDFLLFYRPRHFGEALGVELQRRYPLWFYPWSRSVINPANAWCKEPNDCPDILTHFSERGISSRGLAAEYGWLEGSLRSIREHGFQPGRFRSIVQARRFVRADGSAAYLLLDGNHRVSALSALGYTKVPLQYLPAATLYETALPVWRQVRRNLYSADDAARVFSVYFDGNRRSRTTGEPSRIVSA
jgi:hypothetical protein